MNNTNRTCVVLRTHLIDDDIYRNLYLPLQSSLPDTYHLVVAYDQTRNPWPGERFPVDDLLHHDKEAMRRRNPLHRDNWHSFDSFLDHVYVDRPGFAHYWILEYDVRFSGDWWRFLSDQDQTAADALLINGTWPFNGDHNWWVWHELQWGGDLGIEERCAGYVFLGRYSRELLQCVHEQIGKRSGYAEVYLATLCNAYGFSTAAVDSRFHGSVCATNAGITSDEYARLSHQEPNRIFHKVRAPAAAGPQPVIREH